MKIAVALAALFSLTTPLHAACLLNVQWQNGTLRWDAVPGATGYQIQESFDDLITARNRFTRNTSISISHRASAETKVTYVVTAKIDPRVQSLAATMPPVELCSQEIEVMLPANAEFRALTRRSVVPLVGSTAGAAGGRFKTYLKLTSTAVEQRGRLIFHAAGRAASDSDPSMPYSFHGTGETLVFEDVVAAMGQSGIGSLDIVPAEDGEGFVPAAEVRLYNDTSSGTFGTNANAVLPFDYLSAPGVKIEIPDSRFRVNTGFRALTAATVKILIYGTDRRLRDFRDREFPAGWMQLTTAADLAGTSLAPGESITLLFGGSVIPFYTITENRTNDPTLIVPPPRATSSDVGRYVE